MASKARKSKKAQLKRRQKDRIKRSGPKIAVDRAMRHIEQEGDYQAAQKVLQAFLEKDPNSEPVLALLLDVDSELRDFHDYCRVAQQLVSLRPDDPDYFIAMAASYLTAMQPVSSLLAFEEFLNRWPEHKDAGHARQEVLRMKPVVDKMLEEATFPESEKYELASLHEGIMAATSAGRFDEVVLRAEELLRRQPDFIPAKNNLTEGYFRTNQGQKAIAIAKEVLEQDPANVHATANLTRLLFLLGRFDESQRYAERLREIPLTAVEACVKACEALSFLGDYDGIIEIFLQAEKSGFIKSKNPDVGLLLHLSGVAYARKGDSRRARKHWKRAATTYDLGLARENLDDADLPVSERHGPWAYDLSYWIPRATLRGCFPAGNGGPSTKDDQAAEKAREFCYRNPHIIALLPALLDRGGEFGREFAYHVACMLETTETISTLRDFCLSDRGPDRLRNKAGYFLNRRGELPDAPQRMYLGGKWQDILVMGYEISDEPTGRSHSPQVDELNIDAIDALRNRDGDTAELLLRQALELEPDAQDLLQNLAMALLLQNRIEESQQLTKEIHQRWPDYFFGRIGMAGIAIMQRRFDEAESHLAPLRRQKRLHTTEYSALCQAQSKLYAAQGNYKAANSWRRMWEDFVAKTS